ncbi:MAG TPA: hypothetical protein DGT23_28155 [Micromonosporaceae bacterium]|nr:hypothetical protein [Micromonosporaceae bacterium]
MFQADERVDIDALVQFAGDSRPIALLFDSVADFADDIEQLLERGRKAGLRIACVAVDQTDRSANILGRINHTMLVDKGIKPINRLLSRTDAARLVDKLGDLGRLGKLEALGRSGAGRTKVDQARINHFRGQELFAAMATVEDAPGFGRRVGDLVRSDRTETNDLPLILLASVAYFVDRRLHVIDAARMLGIESEAVVRRVRSGDTVSALIATPDGQWLRARQRWLALKPCIERLGEPVAMTMLSTFMRRIANRLSRASQRERNSATALVGALMTYKNVHQLFPSADIDAWYENLHDSFGPWSARYWEQRAIACRSDARTRPELLSRAESYAERAVSILPDTYTFTTLGTILLSKASAQTNKESMGDYYDRAYDAFESAQRSDPNNLVIWIAFLRYALPVIKRVVESHWDIDAEVRDRTVNDWQRIYDQTITIASNSESTSRDLESIYGQYKRMLE